MTTLTQAQRDALQHLAFCDATEGQGISKRLYQRLDAIGLCTLSRLGARRWEAVITDAGRAALKEEA